MSLIAELKRRNVFRVGVAYAIVAWLLIEVAPPAGPGSLLDRIPVIGRGNFAASIAYLH
jgi:hypothetical protein